MRGRLRALLPRLHLLPALSAWVEWLVETRFAGRSDDEIAEELARLNAVRDRVLDDAAVGPGDTVIDVGAGLGLLTYGAHERVGPDGSVVAVDPDVGCIEQLRRLATAGGVSYLVGQADVLPLPDEYADAVVMRSVLTHVDDLAEAAREFFRVLRPGGRSAGFEPLNRKCTYMHDVVDWSPLGDLGARVQADERRFILEQDPLSRLDDEHLRNVFREAGFDVEVEVLFEDAAFGATRGAIDARLDAVAAPGHQSQRQRLESRYGRDEAKRVIDFLGSLEGQTIPVRWASLFFRAVRPA